MSDIDKNPVSTSFLVIVGALAMMFFMGFLLAFPTKWLMNWLIAPDAMAAVFGVAKFDVWHAWGLNVLAGFLFKGATYSSQ